MSDRHAAWQCAHHRSLHLKSTSPRPRVSLFLRRCTICEETCCWSTVPSLCSCRLDQINEGSETTNPSRKYIYPCRNLESTTVPQEILKSSHGISRSGLDHQRSGLRYPYLWIRRSPDQLPNSHQKIVRFGLASCGSICMSKLFLAS